MGLGGMGLGAPVDSGGLGPILSPNLHGANSIGSTNTKLIEQLPEPVCQVRIE